MLNHFALKKHGKQTDWTASLVVLHQTKGFLYEIFLAILNKSNLFGKANGAALEFEKLFLPKLFGLIPFNCHTLKKNLHLRGKEVPNFHTHFQYWCLPK